MSSHQQYLDLYAAHADLLNAGSCAAMSAPRAEAARLLALCGLPDTKEERYKYTSAARAFAPDYGLNLQRIAPAGNPYEAYRCQVPNLSTALFFVVNDVPCPAPAAVAERLPEGVTVCSLRRAAQLLPAMLRRYNTLARRDSGFKQGHDGVTLLNTLLAQDGMLVYLPAGTKLNQPLQIVNVSAAKADFMSVRRLLVIAEAGAKADILLCDHAGGGQRYLTTQVTEVFAGEAAELNFYSIEETAESNTRFATFYAEQAADSRLTYNGVTLTCGTTRNRIDIRLAAPRATTRLCGAVVADKHQRVDNNLLVEHLAPECESDMLYKYVLNGEAVGAFAGKVYVAEGAQQTRSQQTCANLCVTPEARALSQPMLEIYADDVKCNHGATIGKLDESALLYMRQRGIPLAEARLLLQHAFVNDVLRHIGIDHLRERIAHLVDLRFRGRLGTCEGCKMCR